MASPSSHWNHRLVRMRDGDGTILMLCEVFYDASGKPRMRNDGARASGESPAEVQATLRRMERALVAPVIDDRDFPPQPGEGEG